MIHLPGYKTPDYSQEAIWREENVEMQSSYIAHDLAELLDIPAHELIPCKETITRIADLAYMLLEKCNGPS